MPRQDSHRSRQAESRQVQFGVEGAGTVTNLATIRQRHVIVALQLPIDHCAHHDMCASTEKTRYSVWLAPVPLAAVDTATNESPARLPREEARTPARRVQCEALVESECDTKRDRREPKAHSPAHMLSQKR